MKKPEFTEDQEREINARVQFKMEQLRESLLNSAKIDTGHGIKLTFDGRMTDAEYLLNFKDLKEKIGEYIDKEILMPTPSSMMYYQKTRGIQDAAIEHIVGEFETRTRGWVDGQKRYSYQKIVIAATQKLLQDCMNIFIGTKKSWDDVEYDWINDVKSSPRMEDLFKYLKDKFHPPRESF